MALPRIEVQVTADTDQATNNLDRFNNGLSETAAKAKSISAPLGTARGQVRALGRDMKASAAHTTNLMFQAQDMGVMFASGQSPWVIALQQGTQVSGVFQQMKNSGQSAFSGIIGGLAGMLSPLSLMTIGVIAGGAALGQWALSAIGAGEEADELAKRLEQVRETSVNLNLELRQMRLGVTAEELTLMDAITESRKEVARIESEIKNSRAGHIVAASGQLEKEQAILNDLQSQLDLLRQQQSEKRDLAQSTRGLAAAEAELARAMGDFTKEAIDAANEAELLRQGLSFAAIDALKLAGIDISSPISAAASEAAVLAANLGIALNEAISLKNLQDSMEYSGRGGDPRQFGDQFARDPNEGTGSLGQPSQDLINTALRRVGGGRGGSRGGGGGGGMSEADRMAEERASRIEALVESLKTEREVLEEWRTEGLELLNTANEAELEALGGHAEAKLRLEEEYQERLKGMRQGYNGDALDQAQQFFGDMANAMQSGNEKMQRIAQAFASIEALINAYRAYNQVIADPSLPWYAKIPAAAGVLAAGMKTVQSLKSLGGGGGGVSGAGGGGGGVTTPSEPSQQPLDVRVSGLSSGQLMDGMDVGRLLERLQDEAGDRGLRITVAR